jgi:hypothetical protein
LASNWADIGWQLQHAKDPDDIRTAFEPLKDANHRGFLTPFLRPTEEKATAADLRKNRGVLEGTLTRQRQTYERHRSLLERSQLADTAVTQALPEQREAVGLAAEKHRAELEEAKRILDKADGEVRFLEEKLRDQEAYYCRTELFNFIRSRKYACNPRNLAFAMTGLPYMGCCWSVSRCRSSKPNLIEVLNYRLFEFIRRTWERRESMDEQAAFKLFEAATRRLPKRDYLRTHLAGNWRALKRAIQYGLAEGRKPEVAFQRVPYLMASNFLRSLTSKTAVEQVLAEQEQLDLA